MINFIKGIIKKIDQMEVTLLCGNFGFAINVPKAESLKVGSEIELFIYMHWNSDSGPSFYGFLSEIEKSIFILAIDCPKVGPKIALNILSNMSPGNFIEVISTQNEKALSAISGIGKKSEGIIAHLKHKVSKISYVESVGSDVSGSYNDMHSLSEALGSLGYSKSEISSAINHLNKNFSGNKFTFDQLLRNALSYFSNSKNSNLF